LATYIGDLYHSIYTSESSKPEPKVISSALILAKDLRVEEAPIKSPGAAVCDFSLFSLVRYWVWNFWTLEVPLFQSHFIEEKMKTFPHNMSFE